MSLMPTMKALRDPSSSSSSTLPMVRLVSRDFFMPAGSCMWQIILSRLWAWCGLSSGSRRMCLLNRSTGTWRPISSHYSGHVISLDQSEASIQVT